MQSFQEMASENIIMLTSIYNKCVQWFVSREFQSFTFNTHDQARIISNIEAKLFQPVELQLDGISTLSILVRRSLAQFLGHKYWNLRTADQIIRNAICLFSLPFYVMFYLFINAVKISKSNRQSGSLDAVLISNNDVNLYTGLFEKIYPAKAIIEGGERGQLTGSDLFFIINIMRSYKKIIFYPELVMRVVRRIAQYSFIVNRVDSKSIVSIGAEGSPWSSILTAYCRMKNVKHVQIMHGIRFYSSQMAFAEFDEYYVWGEYHCEEYRKMHVKAKRFIITGNPIHQKIYMGSKSGDFDSVKHRLLICYDPIMMFDNIFTLVTGALEVFAELGWAMKFRPHPSFMKESLDYLKRLQETISIGISIDNSQIIPFIDSVKKAEVVLSCYSNTLTDAWIAGKKCIYIPNERIPTREYYNSKNIRTYHVGDDMCDFILSPIVDDANERILKNRFSYNFDSSLPNDRVEVAS